MLDYALGFRNHAERVIAAGRLVLGGFFLLAQSLDPPAPPPSAEVVFWLLAGYVAYAAVLAAVVWNMRAVPAWIGPYTHVPDFLVFSLSMHFTASSTSPLLVSSTFVIVSATLRWRWRGAIWTGAAALAAYVAVTAASIGLWTESFQLSWFVKGTVHLIVITGLLAYFGAHVQELYEQLTRLADWPRRLPASADAMLRDVLLQAAIILEAPRIILTWHELDEPWLYIASHTKDSFSFTREAPQVFERLVCGALTGASFICVDATASSGRVVYSSGGPFQIWTGAPLDARFCERFGVRDVLAAPVASASIEGALFALDKRRLDEGDLRLGQIVGRFVAGALEHQRLLKRLRDTVAGEERLRLARDLHDGVLQSLAAIALQLRRVRETVMGDPVAVGEHLDAMAEVILAEQRGLRALMDELKAGTEVNNIERNLTGRLQELAARMAWQWNVRIRVDLQSPLPPLSQSLGQEVCRITEEAIANAIRHGLAKEVRLACASSDSQLRLSVAYKGRGFATFKGRHTLAALTRAALGPRTVKERVRSAGGDLAIESDQAGARVEVVLPIPKLPSAESSDTALEMRPSRSVRVSFAPGRQKRRWTPQTAP